MIIRKGMIFRQSGSGDEYGNPYVLITHTPVSWLTVFHKHFNTKGELLDEHNCVDADLFPVTEEELLTFFGKDILMELKLKYSL